MTGDQMFEADDDARCFVRRLDLDPEVGMEVSLARYATAFTRIPHPAEGEPGPSVAGVEVDSPKGWRRR